MKPADRERRPPSEPADGRGRDRRAPQSPFRWLLAGLLGLAPLLVASSGCSTAARGGPASFASVIVEDHTMEEIGRAAIAVFTSHAYATTLGGPDILVFEKPGGSMDNLLYGGWSPGEVTIRVKVYLTASSATSYLVSCNGFLVRNANDMAIEDEQRLTKLRRGPYQKLLEEMQERLKQPAAASVP